MYDVVTLVQKYFLKVPRRSWMKTWFLTIKMLPDNDEVVGIPVLQFVVRPVDTSGNDSAADDINTEGPEGDADVL